MDSNQSIGCSSQQQQDSNNRRQSFQQTAEVIAQNWRQLLQAGDVLDDVEQSNNTANTNNDLAKYIGVTDNTSVAEKTVID